MTKLNDNLYLSELSNGIKLGVRHVKDAKQVTLCFAIGAGSACEDETLNGIAHMITHMHILGTKKRSASDISQDVEATGAEIQFFVHPEKIEYYLHLAPQYVEQCIEIMADCLLNSIIPEEALIREQTVIEQEIVERHDNPFVLASDLFNEACFPKQGNGFCQLGTKKSMFNLNVHVLKNYRQEYFYPINYSIAAFGNITMETLYEYVHRYFGNASNGEKSTFPARITPRFTNGHRYVTRPNRNELAHSLMGFPLSDEIRENAVAQIISKILGSGTSSRFFQGLRQERALGYTMASKVESYGGISLLKFYFSGWMKSPNHNLLKEACKLVNAFPSNITEREVESGKNKVIHEIEMAIDNPFSSCGMLTEQLLYGGDPYQLNEYIDYIESTTFEHVKQKTGEILSRKPSLSFVGNYEPPSYVELVNILGCKEESKKAA